VCFKLASTGDFTVSTKDWEERNSENYLDLYGTNFKPPNAYWEGSNILFNSIPKALQPYCNFPARIMIDLRNTPTLSSVT